MLCSQNYFSGMIFTRSEKLLSSGGLGVMYCEMFYHITKLTQFVTSEGIDKDCLYQLMGGGAKG